MNPDFNIKSYHYDLPAGQIAQVPSEIRDKSRLLVLNCRENTTYDMNFTDIMDFVQEGDLLVVNDTKVFPARLQGKKETGGRVELFLLEYPDFHSGILNEMPSNAEKGNKYIISVSGLLKSSKKPKPGSRILFSPALEGEIMQYSDDGKVKVKLYFHVADGGNPEELLLQYGRVPLPPYIQRQEKDLPQDRERYQTLFARKSGAVAAPTAGLHFSRELLRKLERQNVQIAPITLHVGYGTFAPVRVTDIRQHTIHEEYIEVPPKTAELINRTRNAGKKIWAVGTTTVRTLEYAADANGEITAQSGWCGLYIYPGYKFKVVSGLITNFHLPGSSLLFLVAAMAGRENILRAYRKAIDLGYRFYSYGDAMLIIP